MAQGLLACRCGRLERVAHLVVEARCPEEARANGRIADASVVDNKDTLLEIARLPMRRWPRPQLWFKGRMPCKELPSRLVMAKGKGRSM